MREKLIELFEQEYERCQNTLCYECKYDNSNDCGVDALVDHLIANDVVPVVRCKDCKYYSLGRLECHNGRMNGIMGIDGFCSNGERREGE